MIDNETCVDYIHRTVALAFSIDNAIKSKFDQQNSELVSHRIIDYERIPDEIRLAVEKKYPHFNREYISKMQEEFEALEKRSNEKSLFGLEGELEDILNRKYCCSPAFPEISEAIQREIEIKFPEFIPDLEEDFRQYLENLYSIAVKYYDAKLYYQRRQNKRYFQRTEMNSICKKASQAVFTYLEDAAGLSGINYLRDITPGQIRYIGEKYIDIVEAIPHNLFKEEKGRFEKLVDKVINYFLR